MSATPNKHIGTKNTFSKYERLSKRKDIQELFSKGSSFFVYPFNVRYHYKISDERYLPSVLISVPKKKIKHANKRNTVKRKTREAYRLQKHFLASFIVDNNLKLDFALIYVSGEVLEYQIIENKLSLVLKRLESEIKQSLNEKSNS